MMAQQLGYDLIGDIHGHADELEALLNEMGYCIKGGAYQHSSRKVIFLGDFIDKGPQQRKVLEIVMPMIQQDKALAVMGNHEFNALSFHTKSRSNPDRWLRDRSDKNIKQHLAFLDEYIGDQELSEVISFFKGLPLWLDLNGLRVVHACWEPGFIEQLSPLLNDDKTITEEFLQRANDESSVEYTGIEALLKGVEYQLPENRSFKDKYGVPRHNIRTKWWSNEDSTIGQVALSIGDLGLDENVANLQILADDLVGYPIDQKPLFLGHYWLEGHPVKLAPNVACLDYSVANGGKLVAYRWDGEATLDDSKFFYVNCCS